MKEIIIISTILTFIAFNNAYPQTQCKGRDGLWYDYGSAECSLNQTNRNSNATIQSKLKKTSSYLTKQPQRMGPSGIIGSKQLQPLY